MSVSAYAFKSWIDVHLHSYILTLNRAKKGRENSGLQPHPSLAMYFWVGIEIVRWPGYTDICVEKQRTEWKIKTTPAVIRVFVLGSSGFTLVIINCKCILQDSQPLTISLPSTLHVVFQGRLQGKPVWLWIPPNFPPFGYENWLRSRKIRHNTTY